MKVSASIRASRRSQHQYQQEPPGVWDPAAWCVAVRVTTDHSADYIPRSGKLNSCERVGFPLGEQVVHFRVVFVIGHAVVREAIRGGTHGVAEITGVGFHSA